MKSGTLVRYTDGTERAGEVYWVVSVPTQPLGMVSLSENGVTFDHATLEEWLEIVDF